MIALIALALAAAQPKVVVPTQQQTEITIPADDVARGRFPNDDPKLVDALAFINTLVNKSITYEDDQTHYGMSDKWVQYPADGKGDCEDYAITKLGLIEQGGGDVVENTKLVFVAFVVNGQAYGHAILAVRLPSGDVMYLDINYKEPMTRTQLEGVGYHFFDWKA